MFKIIINIFVIYSMAIADADGMESLSKSEYCASISRATIRLILDFYSKCSSTLTMARASISSETHIRQSEYINDILLNTNAQIVIVLEEYNYLNENFGRFYNILFIDSYEAFRFVKLDVNVFKLFY